MMRRRFRLVLAPAIAASALAAAPGVGAQSPPSDPAIGQYVETLPTSGGGTIVGTATKKGRPLAPGVREKITREAGKRKAPVLEYVATSTSYGAPQAKKAKTTAVLKKGGRSVGAGATSELPPKPVFTPQQTDDPEASPAEAFATAVTSVADVSEARIVGLFALLFVISASALTLAAQRRKQPV